MVNRYAEENEDSRVIQATFNTRTNIDGLSSVLEVQDVARFIYYMNAQHASLDFVKDIEKVKSFFNKLRDMKLANQTIFNYLKHVRRQCNTNSCKFFIEVTEDIQKRLSRGISREVVGKKYQALMTSTKTPRECKRVLDAAKPSFLKCIQNVKHSKV
ncbi:unnamed protein product [Ranitomeya imitator]|uniref:Uncharacterized protein n=1 Tax=Ranitomeya imitator TaxID=111125 RepID=A0ABN9LQS6_9NEOB|nr:unnamed protein product [Ranitomeya imitator]